jgi:hypothetical protein
MFHLPYSTSFHCAVLDLADAGSKVLVVVNQSIP